MRPALIFKNSLDCELGTFEVECDDNGPLMLAAFAHNTDLRSALSCMEPGDTLTMVDLDAEWQA